MEENKNYAFKYEPLEKKITDKNGSSKMTILGNGAPLGGDFENNSYVIANHVSKNKPKARTKSLKAPGAMTQNIGPGSSGFAGVATLAAIIAIAGVVIAYLTLRY